MTNGPSPHGAPKDERRFSRRQMLGAGCTLALGGSLAAGVRAIQTHEGSLRADVFIGGAPNYDCDLLAVLRSGFRELGLDRSFVRGKRVLLKPNLVETAIGRQPINTHPSVVVAAAEFMRSLGAGSVVVAEGQGHRRDSLLVLEESSMGQALDRAGLPFVDLNHDDVVRVSNAGSWSSLGDLYLPRTLVESDIIVSLPKLKTHHWAGMTCAMKNLFGVMPGIVYGWPKNPLHVAGIQESILDINATVRPHFAIVDAVVCMEGDGPIMGDPKVIGCIVMGRNLPAVDATCARLMELRASGISYLSRASGRLGPILSRNIRQRGERVSDFAAPFALLDLPHLSSVRG